MTSGNFTTLPIDSIIVNREYRQRKVLNDTAQLELSIQAVGGLIHPIVVKRDNTLVAGERRLTACRNLGWVEIPVQFLDELDPTTAELVELEENVKRSDLTWQDLNDAYVRYHELQMQLHGPSWTFTQTAELLGLTSTALGTHLSVYRERQRPNSSVGQAETFRKAINLSTRNSERRSDNAVNTAIGLSSEGIEKAMNLPFTLEPEVAPPTAESLLVPPSVWRVEQKDFLAWAKEPQETKYNFVHCDFPYGVTTGDNKGQGAGKDMGYYADTEEVYKEFLNTICVHGSNFIAPRAHMMFWFAMNYYQETFDALTKAGWVVNRFPLIWHKPTDAGILPDSNRGPRRSYETAFLCAMGDRKIVKATTNCVLGRSDRQFHQSEKPFSVLNHYFKMLVDESTFMLDPTCGSGMAVRAAHYNQAALAVGFEINSEFLEGAQANCSRPFEPADRG